MAYARAKSGDMAGAQALIATIPTDGDLGVRMRGRIAELAGQRAEADRWFTLAIRQAPSIPFAHVDWAQVLLARGDADAAIVQAKLATRKSPRFADAHQVWGEALAAKGDHKGASARFKTAANYAPNWGRLHLKWAQSLARQGKTAEAREHLATARRLDLTAAERAELNALRP